MKDGLVEGLQGRLDAQRRVIAWLVRALTPEQAARMIAELSEPVMPQDGQEDPGAVPVGQFAELAAYTAEMRVLLEAAGSPGDEQI